MKNILLICTAVLLTAWYGCETIEGSQFDDISNVNTGQKVLVEEFTGHKCGNCPEGARKLQDLSKIYGDRLIIISEHIGKQFAGTSKEKYTTDFRTATGEELDEIFKIDGSGFPDGFINRKIINNKRIQATGVWASEIAKELQKIPKAIISIENEYTPNTHELLVRVSIEYKKNSSPDDYLSVYLTEDSIVAYQKDYTKDPEDIPDYVHRHVLRGAISTTLGEQISPSVIKVGNSITKTFRYVIDESKINPKHCSVVAFMTTKPGANLKDDPAYMVLQAAEKHIE